MLPSLFGISQSIKQQQKRRWGRVCGKRGGFVCGVSELCRILLPDEVMATMSRQYSPQSPAWSQDVPRITIQIHSTRASAQGFAPQIRIHGRDVTEKRTHGHDTSFAFWNLNKNVMKPQESSRSLWCLQPCGLLADCSYTGIYIYIHIYIHIYIYIYTYIYILYRGREEFCKRQRQMQAHAGTMKRGPLGSFRFWGGFLCRVSEFCCQMSHVLNISKPLCSCWERGPL